MSLLWLGLVLGCGRRGAPAPLHPAPAVVVEQATLDAAGLAVTLAVVGAPGLTVQRAEVALWQAGQVVETTHTEGTLVVLFADGAPGVFRLTGSVYGSYWPGQREIITLDVSGEVNP